MILKAFFFCKINFIFGKFLTYNIKKVKGDVFMKIKLKPFLISIFIPVFLIGGVSALLTMNSMNIYSKINEPPLSPPSWLFPIVWTILFILMGIASYIIYESDNILKKQALIVYALQLIFNFIWTLVFFNAESYIVSAFIIIALLSLIAYTIYLFYQINKTAAFLLIPYFIWVAFATYLNIGIATLN